MFADLWFTVNRLQSAARIASYISLFLEPEGKLNWIGWENSLRAHRIWNTIAVAVTISFFSATKSHDAVSFVAFLATLLAVGLFSKYCYRHRPDRMKDMIEVQRATWIAVVEDPDIRKSVSFGGRAGNKP